MTDTAEYWRDVREWAKERKAQRRDKNRSRSVAMLSQAGIKYETRNNGYHFIIRTSRGAVNFYPTTERYTGVLEGIGADQLIRDLKTIVKE